MYNLTLKSEYSFGESFAFLKRLHDEYSYKGVIGVSDFNTFAVHKLKKMCDKSGTKPIFGYRVNVVKHATEKVKPRGQFGKEYIIIARNIDGLKEIFKLTKINTENFYYRPNISCHDIENLTNDVIVISQDPITQRVDFLGIGFKTPNHAMELPLPRVFVNENFYCTKDDKKIYNLMTGGKGDDSVSPQHILTRAEARHYFGQECISNLTHIVNSVENFKLTKAPNIKAGAKIDVRQVCYQNAKYKVGSDWTQEYMDRLNRELELLEHKGFLDYIVVVYDLIKQAKEFCLVGAGRGSSAGSLVCYLLDITTVDPIKFGLIFERFVDINRDDEPDIDTDFPDNKRDKVINILKKQYGQDSVKSISNISRWAAKVTLNEFAKTMMVPSFETDQVKDSLVRRLAGDTRPAIEETKNTTEVGKEYFETYPQMMNAQLLETHSKNKGKHAAGVIVCNSEITNYCGIDIRDETVYLDKNDCSDLNLLKIDVLGLRTLAVLEDCAKLIGMNYLDYYKLPLNDPKTFTIFEQNRLTGIFQFEGDAMKQINKEFPMESFNDICVTGALGRPGALSSGGTARYLKLRSGERQPVYHNEIHQRITEETLGIIVYQEQTMFVAKELANMSWEQVSLLRKSSSKSKGDDYFIKTFMDDFVNGCMTNPNVEISEEVANQLWSDISSSGSYSFNKSHSVSYAFVSYWTAFMKAHYGLQFIASVLNNSKSDDAGLKILREYHEKEDLVYKPVDPDNSGLYWSVVNGELIGGLTNMKGVGLVKARTIIKIRNGKAKMTPSIMKMMVSPVTPFDFLYPTQHYWGKLFDKPSEYGLSESPTAISEITEGEFYAIGKLIHMDDSDMNELSRVKTRGYEIDGQSRRVSFRIEDDTDNLVCIISNKYYNSQASSVNTAKVNSDWLCVKGFVKEGLPILFVTEVANLSRQLKYDSDEYQEKLRRETE